MSARPAEPWLRKAAGQNTATMFPEGKIATLAFDKVGRRTTMVDWGGTSTYSFDALGRQSGQTDAAGFVQSYGYDPNGNRTSLNLVATGLFTYTFDSLNRLATAQKPGNALYTMAYDADSRRTTMMLGNGSKRLYAYDVRSQLTTQVELNASNVPIVTLIDSYDPVGNRMTRSVNGVVATWTYDDLYRLTGQMKPGQVATYTLDGVGNLKTMWEGGNFPKTFTHDAADKITTMIEGANLTTYTWTGYGALASEITGNSTTGYAYSGQDQLIAVTDPIGAKTTYSFDGDGLRRSTLYEDQSQDPPVEMRTTFVWDGSDYLLLNGPSSNTVVLTLDGEIVSSGSFDLLPDSLGSVIGDIRAGQDPRVPFSYWPYGTLLPSPVKPSFPFLYVGTLGYYTDSTDRDYVRARELMKSTGRWTQVDPIWPHERAYAYALGSPTVLVDYAGLQVRQSCPTHGAYGHNCVFSGPPGSGSDPAYWHCNEPQPPGPDPCIQCMANAQKEGASKLAAIGITDPGWFSWENSVGHCVVACIITRRCPKCFKKWQDREDAQWWNPDSNRDRFNNWMGWIVAHSNQQCVDGCLNAILWYWSGWPPPKSWPRGR